MRTVLLTKGEKVYASIIGFAEVSIWLLIVGKVISNINKDPFQMLAYAVGFAIGNYLGSLLEDKLAIGLITVNIITNKKDEEKLVNLLRSNGVGVTTVDGKGMQSEKSVIIIHVKRKIKNKIVKWISDTEIKCVISVSDIKYIYGGYGIRK